MSDTRAARAKKNIFVSLGCQLITIICGIIVPKLMLDAFGSEAYGATASIAQFLSYITLLEGGIGGVARAALYKPLAGGDTHTISAIMREIRGFFRIIGCIFLVYVLIIACSFRSISHLECFDWLSTFMLVAVISLSTFGQYFIGISNSILLQAAQKSYITNMVNIAGTVINAMLVIVLIHLGYNIIVVKLFSSIIFAMKPVVLWLYVRRNYHIVKVPKADKSYLTQKWSGMGQHIAFYLHSNVDVVILTCFADLKAVAVYSVYNMVVTHIQNLASSFTSGMEALFGDMLAKKEQEKLSRTFDLYELIISVVTSVLFSVTAVMIIPFVRLYTAAVTDADYIVPLFSVLLIFSAVLYCIRMPYHALVIAAGHFRQTRLAAYGEVVINLVLSVILVSEFGLAGVAAGTIAATGFRLIYYVVYLSKQLFMRSIMCFVKRFSVNMLTVAAVFVSGSAILENITIGNYGVWALCGALAGVIAAVITAAVNLLFYRRAFVDMIKAKLK